MTRRDSRTSPSTRRQSPITDVVVLAGVVSAALVAMVDAATSGSRLQGEAVTDRWFWLWAFAVSAVTVVAGIESAGDHAASRAVRALLGSAAILNLAVACVSIAVGTGAWPLAVVYVVAAAGLTALAGRGATPQSEIDANENVNQNDVLTLSPPPRAGSGSCSAADAAAERVPRPPWRHARGGERQEPASISSSAGS